MIYMNNSHLKLLYKKSLFFIKFLFSKLYYILSINQIVQKQNRTDNENTSQVIQQRRVLENKIARVSYTLSPRALISILATIVTLKQSYQKY